MYDVYVYNDNVVAVMELCVVLIRKELNQCYLCCCLRDEELMGFVGMVRRKCCYWWCCCCGGNLWMKGMLVVL